MSLPYKYNPSTRVVDFGSNTVLMSGTSEWEDDTLLTLGTDGDIAIVNRSTTLGSNTALTSVLIGTPVTPAIAANSLIISDATASGDILIAANLGGNSQAWLWVDSSASLMTLYAAGVSAIEIGASGIVINEGSADRDFRIESNALSSFLVIDGNSCLNGQIAFGGAVPTNPQAFFGIFPQVNATGVTADQSYFHMTLLPAGAVTIPATTAPVVASVNIHEPNITATGAVTDACTVRIVDAPTEGGSGHNYALWVDAGACRFDGPIILSNAGILAVPSSLTAGIFIDQGTADDAIFQLASAGDVTHGMTTLIETGTYFDVRKVAGANGGALIRAFTDVTTALVLEGLSVTEDTTDAPTTSSLNCSQIRGGIKSGSDATNVQATGNLFAVQNHDATNEFVVKGDGELYSNQSATVGTFDDHDDAILAFDLSRALSNQFSEITKYGEKTLEALGILGPKDENGGRMYSLTKLEMLNLCGLAQIGRQLKTVAAHLGLTLDPNGGLLPAPQ